VSVVYPLASEHKFPAAPKACYAPLLSGLPGTHLTAVVAQMVRDQGGPALIFQLMIYPDTDFRRETPSVEAYAGKYGNLTKEDYAWFTNHYLNSAEDMEHPQASPLLAPSLCGLPPALIITAEYDTMRDEGE
jgi:acetyl esterase